MSTIGPPTPKQIEQAQRSAERGKREHKRQQERLHVVGGNLEAAPPSSSSADRAAKEAGDKVAQGFISLWMSEAAMLAHERKRQKEIERVKAENQYACSVESLTYLKALEADELDLSHLQ